MQIYEKHSILHTFYLGTASCLRFSSYLRFSYPFFHTPLFSYPRPLSKGEGCRTTRLIHFPPDSSPPSRLSPFSPGSPPPPNSPLPAQLSPFHPAHPSPPNSSPPTKLPMTTTLQQQPTTTHPHQPAHNNQYYAAHNPRPRPPLFRGAGGMNIHRGRGYDNNLPASHINLPTSTNITQLTTRSRALPSSEGPGV